MDMHKNQINWKKLKETYETNREVLHQIILHSHDKEAIKSLIIEENIINDLIQFIDNEQYDDVFNYYKSINSTVYLTTFII